MHGTGICTTFVSCSLAPVTRSFSTLVIITVLSFVLTAKLASKDFICGSKPSAYDGMSNSPSLLRTFTSVELVNEYILFTLPPSWSDLVSTIQTSFSVYCWICESSTSPQIFSSLRDAIGSWFSSWISPLPLFSCYLFSKSRRQSQTFGWNFLRMTFEKSHQQVFELLSFQGIHKSRASPLNANAKTHQSFTSSLILLEWKYCSAWISHQ